ncbi:DUF2177 family protein [Polaromonas sp.]|uniref:DUF2177 family protein n=1 Tax=Polaromonas sp. TaxID=1869339 RepID=UPI0025E6642B|nr:DUF2177 family protein [Polaromonas sp.]
MKYLGVYLTIFLTMFLVDMLWLRVIATAWYAQGLGHLLASSPNLAAAGIFYLLFPAGLLIFTVLPFENSSLPRVVAMGALFGFFAYATYDLSNLATLKDWPVSITLLDIAWGSVVSGLSAGAGKFCLQALE